MAEKEAIEEAQSKLQSEFLQILRIPLTVQLEKPVANPFFQDSPPPIKEVWDRIAPGLASQFDSPYSIPTIAPRPLLNLGGAEDRRCPVAGLEIPRAKASQAYGEFHCLDNFKFIAEPGIWHRLTRFQVKESSNWFGRFLNPWPALRRVLEALYGCKI